MNIKFKVVGLTRVDIKPESTDPEADALNSRPRTVYSFVAYSLV